MSSPALLEASEKEIPLKESSHRWILLALLFTGMLLGYAHRGVFSVAAPLMSKELNFSKAQIGVLLSAFFWFYSFMQMPAGWVVDRFGVKRSYSLSFILWSIALMLTGLAQNFYSLIVLRVGLGGAQAVSFPATARAVANWFQERERGTVTAIYLTGVRLGTALISGVGGYFLTRYSWRLFFLFAGLIPLIWLLPWNLFLRKWEKSSNIAATAANMPSFWASLSLLKNRSVLGIFLGFFAYDYAWFVYITWLPGYLSMERKFSSQEMGLYSAIPYLVMSAVILLSGFASDWLVRIGKK